MRELFGLLPALGALNLSMKSVYPEVAAIAYHFHWSREECMGMSAKERRRWLEEIGKINKEMAKGMKTSKRARK